MKHMFLRCTSVLVLFAVLLFTACKKGDTGPAGEKGEKGDTGATGATGKTGTANVIYSNWQDLTFSAIDTGVYAATITAPKVVDSIIQKGEVKVYWNINTVSKPTVVSLPYSDAGLVFGVPDLQLTPLVKVGTIYIYASYNVSSFVSSTTNEKVWQYRYVIIPGGVSARSAVNWDDYSQVKNYLGLKD